MNQYCKLITRSAMMCHHHHHHPSVVSRTKPKVVVGRGRSCCTTNNSHHYENVTWRRIRGGGAASSSSSSSCSRMTGGLIMSNRRNATCVSSIAAAYGGGSCDGVSKKTITTTTTQAAKTATATATAKAVAAAAAAAAAVSSAVIVIGQNDGSTNSGTGGSRGSSTFCLGSAMMMPGAAAAAAASTVTATTTSTSSSSTTTSSSSTTCRNNSNSSCSETMNKKKMSNNTTGTNDARNTHHHHHGSSCDHHSSKERRGPRNVMLQRMRSLKGRDLNEKYNIDWETCLGEGTYGSVHPGRLRATGEKVALKKISKEHTNTRGFLSETNALLRVYENGGHPNISGLRDMYEDYSHYYLILDLVSGGEMFEHLITYGAYSEADAARLMNEIASALAFVHGVGVVHADLKPENLLLCSKKRHDGTIKMIDFGCAVLSDDEMAPNYSFTKEQDDEGDENVGTTAYWPPERFMDAISPDAAADMWSVGVILYIMLTGVHPFDTMGRSTDEDIEKQILKDSRPPLSDQFVGHLSDSVIDLITKLMERDPNKRLTAYEMLHHPWVRGETALKQKIEDSDKKLSKFKDVRHQLEAEVFALMVKGCYQHMSLSEEKPIHQHTGGKDTTSRPDTEFSSSILKRAFEALDEEGKGFITVDDLGRVIKKQTGAQISSKETKELIATATRRRSNSHSHNYHNQQQQQSSFSTMTTSDTYTDATPNQDTTASLSLSDFSVLLSGLHQKHFPRGHYIFHAGDVGNAMYFINSGKVEIQTRKGQLVAILRRGDFFGEGSLLDKNDKRFTTAKCSTPVDIIEIKRADFDKYLASSVSARHDIKRKWRARHLSYAKNLLRLQKNVKSRTYKKGDIVYKEGDVGTSMFRVDDQAGGELEVSHGSKVVHKYVAGDSFGESSLLFQKPRSSTVKCVSDNCRLYEMLGKDFHAVVKASPELAESLRNMCRKRLFKKAVKAYSIKEMNRGFSDDDIIAAFEHADKDKSGALNLQEITNIMHTIDRTYPKEEIRQFLEFADVDGDGRVDLDEFKKLFRQFEKSKAE